MGLIAAVLSIPRRVRFSRQPFIHPFLYLAESMRHGYRHNRYEEEAYRRAGNCYIKD